MRRNLCVTCERSLQANLALARHDLNPPDSSLCYRPGPLSSMLPSVGSTANRDAGVAANLQAFDARNKQQRDQVRAGRLRVYQRMFALLSVGYAIQTSVAGHWAALAMQLGGVPFLVGSWWALERRNNHTLASHLFMSAQLVAMAGGTMLSGGILAPPVWTLTLVPVTASSLYNSRGTAAWAIITGICTGLLWLLDQWGFEPLTPAIPENERVFLCAIIILALSVTAYMTSSESIQHLVLIDTQRKELATSHLEANQANQAKAKFLARMSHELRTPMNGLLGVTQHLLAEPLPSRDQQAVEVVHRCAENLLTMLNDALDVSKIDASQVDISNRPVDINQLISDIHSLFLAKAKLDGIQLDLSLQGGHTWISTDATRVRQIISNLVGNALRYSDSGRVLVSLRIEETPTPTIYVAVQDEGIGMDKSQLARLFQDFEQVHDDSDSNRGGTGLGLAISKRLAHMLQGDIRVASEPGKGSTFELCLPLVWAQAPNTFDIDRARHQRPTLLKNMRALVVDDSPINLKVATLALQKLGLECETAKDGQEALELCKKNYYDTVFMDIRMPVMDGLAATRAIRAQESKDRRIPIIALTANAYREDEASALEAGMDAYVSKPFKIQDLERALYQVLHQTPTQQIEDCRMEHSTTLPRSA